MGLSFSPHDKYLALKQGVKTEDARFEQQPQRPVVVGRDAIGWKIDDQLALFFRDAVWLHSDQGVAHFQSYKLDAGRGLQP